LVRALKHGGVDDSEILGFTHDEVSKSKKPPVPCGDQGLVLFDRFYINRSALAAGRRAPVAKPKVKAAGEH
jgi:hypothetical protein